MRIWLKRQVYVNYLKLEIGVLIALMMPGNERIINLIVIKKLNENLCYVSRGKILRSIHEFSSKILHLRTLKNSQLCLCLSSLKGAD